MTPPAARRWPPVPWYWRLLLWSPLLIGGGACLWFIGGFFVATGLSQVLAHRLVPPPYPGSELVDQWQSGSSDSMWDRSTWQTTESPEAVIAHMERYLPAFTQVIDGVYGSHRCEDGPLGHWVAYQINGDGYPPYTEETRPMPCVSVSVDAKPNEAGLTEYRIWISWPAP